ncbi:MAG TPA: CHAT domain-containing protein [Pyrinomonadaceae bacterium]|jgi:hypothetical protein
MRYRDFDLKLEGGAGRGYTVEVIGSPVGLRSAAAPLVLSASAIPAPSGAGGGWSVSPPDPRAAGEALFASLFPAPVRSLWERSEQSLEDGDALRLRLDVRAPELAALPWESIHDGSYHLALSPRRPVARFSFDRPEVSPAESRGPLDFLLAASTPCDAPALPAADEELELTRASLAELQAAGKVGRVEVVRHASLRRLQRELLRPFHVLHYVGHGEFSGGEGRLVLEDDAGRARRVSAETLGYFFRDTPLRLLFLNACRTASPADGSAPLGVAQAALAAGVPAVVAMQDVVRDDLAARFAREFYQALAEGHPLETCVAEGRKALLPDASPGRADWAIPVLFSNAREGLLWKPPESGREAAAAAPAAGDDATRARPAAHGPQFHGTVNAKQMIVGDGNLNVGYFGHDGGDDAGGRKK